MADISDKVFVEYRKFCYQQWDIKIVEKSESKFMKLLAVFLFFNRGFMTDYVTTIGKTVYWPNSDKLCARDFATFFHEAQHAFDFKKNPFWFVSSYLSPQILMVLSVTSLLAFTGNLFWLFSLLWLLALLPFPSILRTYWELRGYSCTMAYDLWTRGEVPDYVKEHIEKNFTSSAYYFMWPFSRSVEKKLFEAEERIRNGEMTEVQRLTGKFLVDHGIAIEDKSDA